MSLITTVFFDLGETLGVPVLSFDGRLERFDSFDFAEPVLKQLREKELRLGVISNTGDEPGARLTEVLKQVGLLDYFERTLLIYSKDVGPQNRSAPPSAAGFSRRTVCRKPKNNPNGARAQPALIGQQVGEAIHAVIFPPDHAALS